MHTNFWTDNNNDTYDDKKRKNNIITFLLNCMLTNPGDHYMR